MRNDDRAASFETGNIYFIPGHTNATAEPVADVWEPTLVPELNPEPPAWRPRLRFVHLSRAPIPGSALAALGGLAALMLVHVVDQQNWLGLSRYLSATPRQVYGQHEYWRLFTAMLVHADLGHFLSNTVFFTGLAFLLRAYYGLWAFPTLSFLGGAVTNAAALATYPDDVTLVGASGMVFFMAALWMGLYIGIERRIALWKRLVVAIGILCFLYFPETAEAHVSYRTHFFGLVAGLATGLAWYRLRRAGFLAEERYEWVET